MRPEDVLRVDRGTFFNQIGEKNAGMGRAET
jgi:hypothetical protein